MNLIFKIIFFVSLLFLSNDIFAQGLEKKIKREVQPTLTVIKEKIEPKIGNVIDSINKEKKGMQEFIITPNNFKPLKIREYTKEQKKESSEELKNNIEKRIKDKNLKSNVRISGIINEIGQNYIKIFSIEDRSKIYQVNIDQKTQLRRHFWGKSSLSEFLVGHEVYVIGRYIDEKQSTIQAILIRNQSIQKRWGVFFGYVLSNEGNILVIKTVKYDEIKVYVDKNTRLINIREELISLDKIKIGHRVRVKGVWDKNLNEIRKTEEIKDFYLPKQPTKFVIQKFKN